MSETRLDMGWGTRLSAELRAALLPPDVREGTNTGQGTGTRSRRDFLRAAGALGVGGAALGLVGCAGGEGPLAAVATDAVSSSHTPGTVVLDFATDVGVLNYAYALEQLEAAFFDRVVTTDGFEGRFAANEVRVLRDLRDHEVAHRDFYAAALGGAAIPGLSVDFSAIDFTSRTSVLETARTFEDLGVAAYNGAGRYLRSAAFLTVAGKIVSIEARHAAAIRSILEPRTGAFAPAAFDGALAPGAVLAAADPFVVTPISLVNA